jgi:hypothetical protein
VSGPEALPEPGHSTLSYLRKRLEEADQASREDITVQAGRADITDDYKY